MAFAGTSRPTKTPKPPSQEVHLPNRLPPVPDSDATFGQLRDCGVLTKINGHRLDARQGAIFVPCGDCDKLPDILRHMTEQLTPRLHRVALNGGPLVIDSPLSEITRRGRTSHQGDVMIDNILGGMRLKDIETVALVAHAPCGLALDVGLSSVEIIRYLVAAKRAVKRAGEDEGVPMRVACFLHITWQEEGDRTYFVSREAAERWLTNPSRLLPSRPDGGCVLPGIG